MNLDVRFRSLPSRSARVLLPAFCLGLLLAGGPAFGAGTPASPPPGTGADARWNASSSIKPALIMNDFTWFAGHSDPVRGNVRQFYALDIENGILFAATGQGLEIVNVTGGPAEEASYIYGYWDGTGSFPGWEFLGDADWFVKHLDAPAGNSGIVALSMDLQGFAIVKTTNPASPVVAYHGLGDAVTTGQVYSVRAAGTDWAYALNADSQVVRFNLTAASSLTGCLETVPGVGCPNVYKGVVTSVGSSWGSLHGVGNFLATGKWVGAAAGPVKIWSLTDPAAPSQVLQIDGDAMGVAMWQSGSSYYLARTDPTKKLSIHDVSCIVGGSCSSAPVVWSKTLTSPSSLSHVTVSQTGGRTYLYVGGDDLGSCAPQREYLFDVTTPAATSQDDLTPKINAAGYWGWYYQDCPTGFTLVGPRIGKVYASSNGTHLYRAAMSILDAHTVASQAGPPTAGFSWSPSEIYPGTPVQFTDGSSGQPTSWTWSFQDGTPALHSGQTPPTVAFSTAGQKNVNLDVANQFGPGTPASQSVTVIDPVPQVAGVTVSPANPVVCQPITLTATGVTGQPTLAYSWAIPGAVPAPSPTNTNPLVWNTTASTTPNTYTATVTVSNGAGSAQKNVQVTVGGLQSINPTYTPTNDAFAAGTVKFHDNQTAGSVTEWSWDFDDDENDLTHNWTAWTSDPVNGPSPTHTYGDTGTKKVFARVRNCTTTDPNGVVSGALTINIAQITPLVASFQANMLCPGVCFATAGIPVPFVDASTGAEFWDYDWDGNGSWEDANNTAPRTSHTYSTAGPPVTPKLRVRRGTEENIKVHDFAIQISPAVAAGISISGPSSGQVSASLSFTASGTGSCSPSSNGWTWSLAGGTATGSTTGNQVTVSWSSAGGKTLSATNSACSGATGSKTVTISSGGGGGGGGGGTTLGAAFSFTPAAPIAGQAVSFNGSASTGSPTGYAWDFGDGTPIGSGAQVSHTYATAGVYLARLGVSKESSSCPPAPFCESSTTKTVVVGSGLPPLGAAFTTSATCVSEFSQIVCTADAGQQVTFTDQSLGSPTSWSWSFGDGGSATGAQVTHVFTNPGNFTVTLAVGRSGSTDSAGRAFNILAIPEPPQPKTIILPWIAQTRGALLQSSDLYLHNPGTAAMDVTLEFRKRGAPETNPPRASRTIQPGATLYVADVLKELFNKENIAGFISVTVDEGDVTPVITSFNTTFQTDGKQFGQTVAGVPMGAAASAAASQAGNQVEHLVGLIDNDERLAYFGISNPSDEPALYHLRFFDKEGRQIGESDGDLALSRFGQRQFQVRDIHELFGISNADDYRIEIENKTGAHVIPYASNLRLSSEDPSFIKPASSASSKVYLIGVLSAPGANNNLWQTDALLTNIGTQAIAADVTFTSVGLNSTPTSPLHVTLGPGTTERLENVVSSQWGINNAIGVLTVSSASAGGSFPVVQGESYDNTNPAKRFGQSMTAVSDSDAAGAGEAQYLVGLRQDAENRTTFWIYNNGNEAAEYDLVYRRLDGTPLGNPVSVRLGAGKMRQFSPGQHPLPAAGVQDGFTVQIKVKSGKVLSAAQVINNITNDPAYIQGEVR